MEEILSGVEAVDRLIDELIEAINTTYAPGFYKQDALAYAVDARSALSKAKAL